MAQPYLGQIMMFGGTFAVNHYGFCNGALLAVSQYQALYSLLGTMYGGDGRSSFGLPEMRGRIPLHVGTGPGLTPRPQGQRIGTETHSLVFAEMPSHQHLFTASPSDANSTSVTGRLLAQRSESTGTKPAYSSGQEGTPSQYYPEGVESVGEGLGHENMQPYQAINFLIAMQGVFPPRS